MNLLRTCALALGLAFALPACARECAPQLRDGWVRLTPVKMPMMAGFLRIDHTCAKAVEVAGADSLAFAEVSLHKSRQVDGVNKMRELETRPVAAGKSVEFKPGGMHLMLYKPYAPVKEGDKPVITIPGRAV